MLVHEADRVASMFSLTELLTWEAAAATCILGMSMLIAQAVSVHA